MSNIDRKLATIQQIASLEPIEGADKIELAKFEDIGWQVVVQKGLHEVGNLVCFVEVDSFVPTFVAPWLTKEHKTPSVYEGVEGERLRTIRLRKTLSQGIVIPMSDILFTFSSDGSDVSMNDLHTVGFDLTGPLGIVKWERPMNGPPGARRGNFPTYIYKTDQERIQNIYKKLVQRREQFPDEEFEVTEKLDGSSMTVYVNEEGYVGVCSRNWDLEEAEGGNFWEAAKKVGLPSLLLSFWQHYQDAQETEALAIQGELIGPGVQGNKYNLREVSFHCFDIFDIMLQKYQPAEMRRINADSNQYAHAPYIETRKFDFATLNDALAYADGKSALNEKVLREGVVFKSCMDPSFSFKIISNEWLLKHE